MSENSYEFTQEQNKNLLALHKWLNAFTIFLIIVGSLLILTSVKSALGPQGAKLLPIIATALLCIILGILLRRPLDNIKSIVQTEERDIPELMISIDDFRQAFFGGSIVLGVMVLMLVWRVIVVYF